MRLDRGLASRVMACRSATDGDRVNGFEAHGGRHSAGDYQVEPGPVRTLARILGTGIVTGVVGTSVGCLAGALTPGSAYVPVTIAVAGLTSVLLSWHLDRVVALVTDRPGPRPGV
jgi:hypothetical protein